MVTAEPISPAELGFDRTRLGYIDAHLQKYVEDEKLAGTLLLVARNGVIAHFEPHGLADRERRTPMTRGTLFRIYSMTKPITSVALMQLYERGLMQIDDPVEKYIPEFADLRVFSMGSYPDFVTRRPDRAMTIRDLLSHQSGLTYGFINRTNVDAAYRKLDVGGGSNGRTMKDMIRDLAKLPLEFSPGDNWNYSVSTDVCGYLVEVISGRPFDEYLAENIFQPLGMNDTFFTVPAEKADRLAANYQAAPGGLRLIDDPATSEYLKPQTMLSGGGGLVSSGSDYFRFAQALCNEGELEGERVIGRKTLELMTSNHLPGGTDLMRHALGRWAETTFSGIGFGLGFSVTLDPAQAQVSGTPGEFSWGGAASTTFWIDPVEDLVVVFMTQLMPSTQYNIRRELRAMVYAALTD